MPSFKKLALIATEIYGETSAETADTVMDPKTIPPAIFQKWAEGKNACILDLQTVLIIEHYGLYPDCAT